MAPPKSKQSNQPLLTVEHCSGIVLGAAAMARLMARINRPVRIGSSDVAKALDVLGKHPPALSRHKSKAPIAVELFELL